MAYDDQLVRDAIQPDLPVRADAILQIQENLETVIFGTDENGPRISAVSFETPLGGAPVELLRNDVIDRRGSNGSLDNTFTCLRTGQYFIENESVAIGVSDSGRFGGAAAEASSNVKVFLNGNLLSESSVSSSGGRDGRRVSTDNKANVVIEKGDTLRVVIQVNSRTDTGGPGASATSSANGKARIFRENPVVAHFTL